MADTGQYEAVATIAFATTLVSGAASAALSVFRHAFVDASIGKLGALLPPVRMPSRRAIGLMSSGDPFGLLWQLQFAAIVGQQFSRGAAEAQSHGHALLASYLLWAMAAFAACYLVPYCVLIPSTRLVIGDDAGWGYIPKVSLVSPSPSPSCVVSGSIASLPCRCRPAVPRPRPCPVLPRQPPRLVHRPR